MSPEVEPIKTSSSIFYHYFFLPGFTIALAHILIAEISASFLLESGVDPDVYFNSVFFIAVRALSDIENYLPLKIDILRYRTHEIRM